MLTHRHAFAGVVSKSIVYLVLVIGSLLSLFPFYWMVTSSFKLSTEIAQWPPSIFQHTFTVEHYVYLWKVFNIPRVFFNSTVVAAATVFLNVVFASMIGYALVKLRFPGRNPLFISIIATMMIPGQLLIIPLFLLMDKYHLLNSYFALVLPAAVSPFSVFLLRQAFMGVPNDFIDAALMDGARHFRILFGIILPMVVPMVVTVAVINFFWTWNAFLWPMMVLFSGEMWTLPVALSHLRVMYSDTDWGAVMAGSTFTAIPIVILYLFMQRRFIESLAMSGIKG